MFGASRRATSVRQQHSDNPASRVARVASRRAATLTRSKVPDFARRRYADGTDSVASGGRRCTRRSRRGTIERAPSNSVRTTRRRQRRRRRRRRQVRVYTLRRFKGSRRFALGAAEQAAPRDARRVSLPRCGGSLPSRSRPYRLPATPAWPACLLCAEHCAALCRQGRRGPAWTATRRVAGANVRNGIRCNNARGNFVSETFNARFDSRARARLRHDGREDDR